MLDGGIIIASYAMLLYIGEGAVVDPRKAALFYVLFLVLASIFRYLDVDYQEQLTRVAGFQIGTTLFKIMAVA